MEANQPAFGLQVWSKTVKSARRLRIPSSTILAVFVILSNEANAQYTESFQSWSATSAGAWETKSLSGAPFNVPASVVVEIAVRNSNTTNSRLGGVRAVGSSLNRRIDMPEAAGGGVDVLTMHVQADASSQIQHYAENTTDIDFVLLRYWSCGTYDERFDSDLLGSSSWSNNALNTYGVGPSQIAEIVITNTDTEAHSAGVRTNGSALQRRVILHRVVDGTDAITILCDDKGRFFKDDLRPGDWYAMAFSELPGILLHPIVRDRVFAGGMWREAAAFRVAERETATLNLKIQAWPE